MTNLIDTTIFYSFGIFFVHYLINHSEIFAKLRTAVFPCLPQLLVKAVSCGFCLSFWIMLALSLIYGFSPFLFIVPVTVLFMDFGFQRLKR
jgi:hypothetical protein